MNLYLRLIIMSIVFILIDVYAFQAIRRISSNKLLYFVYWGTSMAVLINAMWVILNFSRYEGPTLSTLNASGWLLLLYIPKLFIIIFLFGEDIIRLIISVWNYIALKLGGAYKDSGYIPDRRKAISQLAIGVASLPFLSIIYGIAKGKYKFNVITKELFFDDLPEEFDGYQLTQISDIHSGSFDDKEKIKQAIELINQQESDIVVFTGDLVNNKADEMIPWIDIFKKIKAKDGKYSILGNHDYGDYIIWNSPEEKEKNMEKLYSVHKEIEWDLLRNENRVINKGDSKLSIVGVENWGVRFKQKGDLKKSLEGLDDNDFKILLSHDPSHFSEEVVKEKSKIHLTLSGHTHGMQFGIEIPGFKWSPVQYVYKHWAGLFKEAGRYLYVNRGFGFHAFPGRVGIWPEITVIKFRKK